MDNNRKLRYGMVGGGPGAFIGGVHRAAAELDGQADLVAGAFSSDPQKSKQQGEQWHLDPRRVYGSYREMAEREAERSPEERIDFVSIVTPNHLHFDVAKAFIEQDIHIVCDKPVTTTLEDAERLCRLVDERDVVFCLTHTYAGYPMVKQAREMVQDGTLGAIRKIDVTYVQGWLATPLEEEGDKQASWRTDPKQAGAGALGDIGTHAEHLARYVTGLQPQRLCADVSTFVEGRAVDDDAHMLMRYADGARGVLSVSQVAAGEENDLQLRIYGAKGGLHWKQETPNMLRVCSIDGPEKIYRRGSEYLAKAAQEGARIPAGHPEGFIEAFANVYAEALDAIAARADDASSATAGDFPTVADGAAGVHFIERALQSSDEGGWVDAAYTPPTAP